MHLRRDIALACLCVCCIAMAVGQSSSAKPADDPLKIAIIQFQPAVTSTNEFQRDIGEIEKKFDPRRTELKNLEDQIEGLTNQLQKQGGNLSDAERETRTRTLDSKTKQAQRLEEDSENEYNQAVQDLFGRVAEKVGEVLTAYAKEHGFTLVMDRSEQDQETPAVIWANPTTDITQQIVDAYNAKSGVPAPLPSAPGSSPK